MEPATLAQLGRLLYALAQAVVGRAVHAVRHYFEPGDVYQPRHAYVKPEHTDIEQLEQQPKPIGHATGHITVDISQWTEQFRTIDSREHAAGLYAGNIAHLEALAATVRAASLELDYVDIVSV